jgi:protein-tyrosine phosphatase/arsenate reductase
MKQSIKNYCERRIAEFDLIDEDRKKELKKLTAYLRYKEEAPIDLVFICTHNSRRSLFGQVWGKVAAHYYGFTNVETYSAGTETTEIAGNVVYTFLSLQFDLFVEGDEINSRHFFVFDTRKNASICFSKNLNHYSIPKQDFGTIFTCNSADNACPTVSGSELRISLPFEDPKDSDGTSEAQQSYRKCSNAIARELLYVFYKINN